MRKLMFCLVVGMFLMVSPLGVQAYSVTISDPAGDQIGISGFDTTQIVYNVNENPFVVTITTNYTAAGILVGSWQTLPADLLLRGAVSGVYAIPLVTHGVFTAGTLYTVGSMYTSDDIAAMKGIGAGYTWGFGQDVWLKEGTPFSGFTGSVSWGAPGVTYTANNWYWDDTNPSSDYLSISWATATCANDVVGVPEPATLLLLGLGLIGMGVAARRRFV